MTRLSMYLMLLLLPLNACFNYILIYGAFGFPEMGGAGAGLGTSLAYWVLTRLGEGLFDTQLTAQNYLTFLWHTTLPLGVLFELPVLVAFLTSIGLLTPQFLITYRRYAYFVLLVLAVVLTPADFISDLAMTLPLILLFEVSVAISKVIYSRKRRN